MLTTSAPTQKSEQERQILACSPRAQESRPLGPPRHPTKRDRTMSGRSPRGGRPRSRPEVPNARAWTSFDAIGSRASAAEQFGGPGRGKGHIGGASPQPLRVCRAEAGKRLVDWNQPAPADPTQSWLAGLLKGEGDRARGVVDEHALEERPPHRGCTYGAA